MGLNIMELISNPEAALQKLLPPGVTMESLINGLGMALQKVRHVADTVDRIHAEQAAQTAMLRQIIATSQVPFNQENENAVTPPHQAVPAVAIEPGSGDASPGSAYCASGTDRTDRDRDGNGGNSAYCASGRDRTDHD